MPNPVVIAGAGPAGLMLACELGLAGVPATIVERRPAPRTDSPGTAVNAGAVEALELRGLMDRMRSSTYPLPRIHYALEFLDMDHVDERANQTLLLPQTLIEKVLAERAAELGVELLRDHEVVGIEQDDGVTVTVRSGDGTHNIRGSYVVGCDGADSAVRELAGIAVTGTDIPFHGIIGDVETSFGELAQLPLGAKYCPSGGHWMCAPTGPNLVRMMTAEFGLEPPDPGVEVTMDEFRVAIHRLTGVKLDDAKAHWLTRTDCRIKQADRYRQGRVLLAGDAACVIFPVNGLALANALHDSLNLGWKLASVVAGSAPARLLDTYHDERHAVGERTCAHVRAQVTLSRSAGEVGAIRDFVRDLLGLPEVNRYLGGLLSGVDTRYDLSRRGAATAEQHPLTGTRLPASLTAWNGDGDLRTSLGLGRGVVLHLGPAEDGRSAVDHAAPWAGRVDVIRAEPTPELGAGVLLVRPDGHVAWASSRPDDDGLRPALTAWFGAPATADTP